MATQFKTLIIEKRCYLSYENGQIIIKTEDVEEAINLLNVHTILINIPFVSLSAYLINELAVRNIIIIFTDNKKIPSCEVVPYSFGYNKSKALFKQLSFTEIARDTIWLTILTYKIKNQILLIKKLGLKKGCKLKKLLSNISAKGVGNAEGLAARIYFKELFGYKFTRRKESTINIALNYGYSLLASFITRTLIIHGYNTALGIHHSSKSNPFNLTYDLIEPFRPYIDEIVYLNKNRNFDVEYKKLLISVLDRVTIYRNKKYKLLDLIEKFVIDTMHSLDKLSKVNE